MPLGTKVNKYNMGQLTINLFNFPATLVTNIKFLQLQYNYIPKQTGGQNIGNHQL